VRDADLGKQRSDKLAKVQRLDGAAEWLLIHIKWQLTRRLYERGYSKNDVLDLLRLIDWLLRLPQEMEVEFRQELLHYEGEKAMPYVTSFERLGREEGRQEGRQENILDILQARFDDVPCGIRERILTLRDEPELKRLLRQAALVQTLADFAPALSQRDTRQ
jgi:hypothetical protein